MSLDHREACRAWDGGEAEMREEGGGGRMSWDACPCSLGVRLQGFAQEPLVVREQGQGRDTK